MKIMTGADCESIMLFESRYEKMCFRREVFTDAERSYIESKKLGRFRTATGIWCAKEAAAKALGRGLYGLLPRELEVCHQENGAPYLKLHGSALEQYGHLQFSVSISHSRDTAFAVCTVLEE